MEIVNIADAKAHLSLLIEKALAGEEIIIGKRNKALVRLAPIHKETPKKRVGGQLKGQIRIGDDFDELPQEISDAFNGLLS